MPEVVVQLPTLHADQVRAFRAYQRYPRFVLRAGRRYGKSALVEVIACDRAIKGGYVGFFTPDYKVSAEIFNEMTAWLEPVKASSSKVEGVIRTTTGGRIDFWTLDNERAGRSRKYDLVVCDEAAFNKPNFLQIWERAIEPTLLDRNGRAIFASNTNGRDPDNTFFKMWKWCENCPAEELEREPKSGWGEYHAPTEANPTIPERLPGETDAEHQMRHDAMIARLRAEKPPLVYAQEHDARFVSWDGVAFFELARLLDHDGQPVAEPAGCGAVYATVDTATKTGTERDGTAVCYWAITPPGEGPHPLVLLDWDLVQIEGALLETWLPTVFENCEALARRTRARAGSVGTYVEDKASGMVLLQHARNRGWPARPIDSKLTAMGKSERAISVSGYVYRGLVKLSRQAYEKTVVYKGASRNHLLDQVLGFRVGEDQRDKADDLLDCVTYGIHCGLGAATF